MIKTEIIKLVKTLSGAEKRNFKLFCNKQSGQKDYLDLFTIINEEPLVNDPDNIVTKFKNKHPTKSYENTAQYLLKNLTDSLIQIGAKQNKKFQQYFSLMRSHVLLERSISSEGYKELKKAQKISVDLQDNIVQSLCSRLELNHLSDIGFPLMDESGLVEKQMKAKSIQRHLHQNLEHSSLFELLRYRLIHNGRSLTSEDKSKLNDLLISELSLITRGVQQDFESKKTHLLFQSFFLIHIGDYTSSLKSFKELNNLFEGNDAIWNFPPFDYLHMLEGILDNLRTIQFFHEMDFYIQKIIFLLEKNYPEYFQTLAYQIIYINQLSVLINEDPNKAIGFLKTIPASYINNDNLVDLEKRKELLFYIGLSFFLTGNHPKANSYINIILAMGKDFHSGVYRVANLLHLLIHYELDNLSYLDYEIRSFKRYAKKTGKSFKIESIAFKLIKHDPKRNNKVINLNFWKKVEKIIQELNQNRYEHQVLKYFDVSAWIKLQVVQ